MTNVERALEIVRSSGAVRPFVVAQLGQSLDGRIALPSGESRYINGPAALDYLHRIGATRVAEDFRPVLPKLMERTVIDHEASSPTDYEKHGSLLRGDMGAALRRPDD